MPVSSAQVAVGTDPTVIATVGPSGGRVIIGVPTGGVAVSLGPATVVAGEGYTITAGQILDIDLGPADTLYGRVSSSTQPVSTLIINR